MREFKNARVSASLTIALSICFSLLCCDGRAQNAITGPQDRQELEAFMDGLILTLLEDHNIAGAAVSVVKDGALFWAKGYGYADVEARKPISAEKTLFRIGSISKLFVWTSIMQLVEQGKLDLDADINTYLTDFEIPDTYEQPITLKHLMTHTAGFEEWVLGLFGRDANSLRPLAEILAEQLPARVRPPGELASYSNHGTGIAAYIVEQVSGQAWNDYVEQHILQRLEMHWTTFRQPVPDSLADWLSNGYTYSGGEFHKKQFEFVPLAPVGAASASAADMARFMIAHLQYGRFGNAHILDSTTAAIMQTPLHRHAPEVNAMAHGFIEISRNGQRVIGHGGDTFWFHSMLALLPAHGVGLFVSFNSPGGNAAGQTYKKFMDRYYPTGKITSLEPPEDAVANSKRAAGYYRPLRYAHKRFTKLAAAASTLKVTALPDGRLKTASPQVKYWVETAPLVYREQAGQNKMVFRDDENGRISHLFLSNLPVIAFERVGRLAAPAFQVALAAVTNLLFLAAVILWPLAAFVRRRHGITLPPEKSLPKAAKIAGWIASFLLLVFTLGLAGILSDSNQVVYGVPQSLKALLTLPLIAALFVLGSVIFLMQIWQKKRGGFFLRTIYLLLVLFALGFLGQLSYWNLLGFQY